MERANSFTAAAVVRALEGHQYQRLKDPQQWRRFDHQSIQTVYLVQGKQPAEVARETLGLDYFKILRTMPGYKAAVSESQWRQARGNAGRPSALKSLPED